MEFTQTCKPTFFLKNDEENIHLQVDKINDEKMLFCFKLISFRSLSLHLTPPNPPSSPASSSLHSLTFEAKSVKNFLQQHRVDRIINDSKWKTNKHSLLSLNPSIYIYRALDMRKE